jgi:[NiFe] hydrogenase diaphorase moiety large subunit
MNMTPESTVQTSVENHLASWGKNPANLLQVLIGIQHDLHHVPDLALDRVSSQLTLPRAHVKSVIDFYSFLHASHHGDYEILFSNNIIERMQGNAALVNRLTDRLGMQAIGTRDDHRVSVGYTSCTGMSDQGPAALVNGLALTGLTSQCVDHVAELINRKVPVSEWPEKYFLVQHNIQRRDILLNSALEPGEAIKNEISSGSGGVLIHMQAAGLRGRGGAGFNTAKKWRFCLQSNAQDRVVVCNADEGEPGTFKDRVLLQMDADRLFEGMTLCAVTVGAKKGFLYLRGEYRYLLPGLQQTLQKRRDAGLLGNNILGEHGLDFDIEIHLGAGAYICGEESALIESLEGKRGIPRVRPPFPVTSGYLGRPTVVNNVETFIAAAMIAVKGPDWFRSTGTEESPGTKLISISGDCERPGVYEFPFGTSIHRILADCGATDTQAVQIGGAAGQLVPPSEFDRCIAFEDMPTAGSFMVFNRQRDLLDVVENFSAFFVHESCGFCTPCRVGTSLIKQRLDKIYKGHATCDDAEVMHEISALMRNTSHCGLGATAANPILDLLKKFPDVYQRRLRSTSFEPGFDLDASLEEARHLTCRDDPGAHLKNGGV